MNSFEASSAGAVFQSLAVVLAIVALSPVPLALPSGIAVAVIGLMGAVSLLMSPDPAPGAALRCVAPPDNDAVHV
jgi:hypothetical protein